MKNEIELQINRLIREIAIRSKRNKPYMKKSGFIAICLSLTQKDQETAQNAVLIYNKTVS
jgi:hypothetical protein